MQMGHGLPRPIKIDTHIGQQQRSGLGLAVL